MVLDVVMINRVICFVRVCPTLIATTDNNNGNDNNNNIDDDNINNNNNANDNSNEQECICGNIDCKRVWSLTCFDADNWEGCLGLGCEKLYCTSENCPALCLQHEPLCIAQNGQKLEVKLKTSNLISMSEQVPSNCLLIYLFYIILS